MDNSGIKAGTIEEHGETTHYPSCRHGALTGIREAFFQEEVPVSNIDPYTAYPRNVNSLCDGSLLLALKPRSESLPDYF
jgi:hypothetical protein